MLRRFTAVETLKRQVQRAQRRLIAESFLRKLTGCWFAALVIVALAIAIGKLWPPAIDQQSWALAWIAATLVAGTVAAAVKAALGA